MFAAALDQLNFHRDPGFGLRMLKATVFRSCRTASFHLCTNLGRKISLSACVAVRKLPLGDGRP